MIIVLDAWKRVFVWVFDRYSLSISAIAVLRWYCRHACPFGPLDLMIFVRSMFFGDLV